jgi:plastocyanin
MVVVAVAAMVVLPLNISIVSGSSSLTDAAYQRNPVQVSVRDTVTWTDDDSQLHTVTSGVNRQPDGMFG